jgi:hypothetical protein
MGDAEEPSKTALAKASEEAMMVQTMGGRLHVRCAGRSAEPAAVDFMAL